jgi:tetratricopeptide (TPR) repeat protein
MKRDLKKHIKQDEFVTGLGRAIGLVRSHAKEAKVTAATIVVLGAGALALTYVRNQSNQKLEESLSGALEVFHRPATDELPPGSERPAGETAATAAEKYRKAVVLFDAVGQSQRSLPAGRRARYYAALARVELGQSAEAEKLLSELAAERTEGALEAQLARLELAELYRKTQQTDKALAAYRQMVDDASLPLPRDHVLMRLSSLLEEMQRVGEARASYQRLVEQFPGSVYAAEARRRADFLRFT